MIKLISPFFGKKPDWFDKYLENTKSLEKYGFHWLIPDDIEDFKERARKVLQVESKFELGSNKASDFRPMLGLMYEDELKDYEFWGNTDLDCVYGRVDHFMTPELLLDCDVFGNDIGHTCGPWTIYRNTDKINNLFRNCHYWKEMLETDKFYGFDEIGQDEVVRSANIRFKSNHYMSEDRGRYFFETNKEGELFNLGKETMMIHFKDNKVWPNIQTI